MAPNHNSRDNFRSFTLSELPEMLSCISANYYETEIR